MIARWEVGRAEIDQLIAQGRLTPVQASRELAEEYLDRATKHLTAAQAIHDIDAAGAFNLTYDAARLAMAAILINQGLRPRGEGAHAVLLEVALVQLEPPRQEELREFDWMRKLRNDTQYPDVDRAAAGIDDFNEALPAAQRIVDRATKIVAVMPPY